MTEIDETKFEQLLTANLLTPDADSAARDYVTPIVDKLARRDRWRRAILTLAATGGAAITGGVLAVFFPACRSLVRELQVGWQSASWGIGSSQVSFWIALALALLVTAIIGLGGSTRDA